MQETKYYIISEVADFLNISQASLRYIEKIIPKFKVRKIRGRRYYSSENIEILKANINKSSKKNIATKNNMDSILDKIIALEEKFILLKKRLS